MEFDTREHHDAWMLIQDLNAQWKKGDAKATGSYYREDAVMVFSEFSGCREGREAHVAAYDEFLSSCIVHRYSESDGRVDVAGRTAIVTYKFVMIYEREGKRYDARGRDFYVLEKGDDGWSITWRSILEPTEVDV